MHLPKEGWTRPGCCTHYFTSHPIGRNLLSPMAIPGCKGSWELESSYRKPQRKISASISIEDKEKGYWRTTGSLQHRHPSKHSREKLFRVFNFIFVGMKECFVAHLKHMKKCERENKTWPNYGIQPKPLLSFYFYLLAFQH